MSTNYEARHFFMATAIGILFLSPILLLIIPSFIANSMYLTTGTWIVFVPSTGYLIYAIGCAVLVLAALIPFLFKIRKMTIGIGILCVFLSCIIFLLATKPHTELSDNGISYRTSPFEVTNTYAWTEIERVDFFEAIPGEKAYFDFHFHDGSQFTLIENAYVSNFHGPIFDAIQSSGIPVIFK
ncbi:hypothetical protein [Ornithinibacillus contaminans]|uniref:hypothetical protein n=1 Tax=Ornithinibacillus contaminans TaxID=694055 RepID=UPI00064D9DC5|nr:hypothetical protein [Ornithinibacillus contaminans]